MYADNWTIKAKNAGYRSRAVYKLEEILQKTKCICKITLLLEKIVGKVVIFKYTNIGIFKYPNIPNS